MKAKKFLKKGARFSVKNVRCEVRGKRLRDKTVTLRFILSVGYIEGEIFFSCPLFFSRKLSVVK